MTSECMQKGQLMTTPVQSYNIRKISVSDPEWGGLTQRDYESRQRVICEHPTLRVGFKQWYPSATKSITDGTLVYSGFSVELLSILGDRLNLSIEYMDYEDEEWGTLVNGTWTGILGVLKSKKIDIIVPLYSILKDRQEHFDFTYPVLFDGQVIAVYNTTTPEQSIWRLGVNLVSWRIIALTLMSLFATAITLTITQHFRHASRKEQNAVRICETTLCKTWYLIGSLLKQGEDGLQPCSNRIALASWCLFCLIICSSLTAALIASLSASSSWKPLTSLQQLANQRTYKWGMVAGGYITTFAQSKERDATLRRLWAGIEEFRVDDPDVLSSSREVHLKKVRLGSYVFLSDAVILARVLADNCDLHYFLVPFLDQQTSFILQKGSLFTDMLSQQ
ncbi:glutamate receptor ionotropic, delta-1-like [Liolophura sinensis]|uniref:glutamate receptor ionotropic, delta-1-like n=1 Tax=Liolophura sinensis TaxID=3198878 RepID=UPI0031581693